MGEPRSPVPPRVVVADDDALARRLLTDTLAAAGIAVVAQAADGAAAVAAAERCRPDAVVMDLGMPGLDGAAATREILARRPEIAGLLVVSHETVRSHIKHLYRKLGVHSREQAAAVARSLRGD